jgi:hypothetical protein
MEIVGCFSRNVCITNTRAGIGFVFTCVWVLWDDGGYPVGNMANPLDRDDLDELAWDATGEITPERVDPWFENYSLVNLTLILWKPHHSLVCLKSLFFHHSILVSGHK